MDWYPWYFTIYKSDTLHLNPFQDGCYRRLIDHYMDSRRALPDNDAALARIIGITERQWTKKAATQVRGFFEPKDGMLYLYRCELILSNQDERRISLSESGKSGAKKRWKKTQQNQMGKDSHPIGHPNGSPMATLKPIDGTSQDITGYKIREGFDILKLISDEDLFDARSHAPGWDIQGYLVPIYNTAIREGKMEPPIYPRKAFPAWCKSYTKGKRA